ncbi:MAG: hypothetical protein COB20_08430 [SAR86 cluster bacterium]|uniref:Transposase IS200-like domain-containing protein n=1 Tax=SAR86 cluster bacterium TaxID=2030880 RepID=A0A2A4X3Z7_9GAMM|nr:MAG: hypothetical protein COB20_08430 [SAR86 cluster bacterium]
MANRSLVSGKTYFAAIKQKTFGTGFFDDACKEFYLRRLLHCQNAFQVQLHAYLLMEKELFLIFTPLTPSGFDSFVRFLNGSYNRYYLIRFARSVLAWQNEPLVCRLSSDNLVLDCQKFVERYVLDFSNKGHPGEYGYSSYSANAFTRKPSFLKRHRAVRQFINIEVNGLQRYRDFIAKPFREEYERYLQSRLLWGLPLLQQKSSFRLENSRTLTDIEKSVTIATIA